MLSRTPILPTSCRNAPLDQALDVAHRPAELFRQADGVEGDPEVVAVGIAVALGDGAGQDRQRFEVGVEQVAREGRRKADAIRGTGAHGRVDVVPGHVRETGSPARLDIRTLNVIIYESLLQNDRDCQ